MITNIHTNFQTNTLIPTNTQNSLSVNIPTIITTSNQNDIQTSISSTLQNNFQDNFLSTTFSSPFQYIEQSSISDPLIVQSHINNIQNPIKPI